MEELLVHLSISVWNLARCCLGLLLRFGTMAPLQQHDSLGTHARTRLSLQGGFDLKGLP